MSLYDAYAEPLKVMPIREAVIVANPRGGGMVAITPQAALDTAERLVAAAKAAMSGDLPPIDLDLDDGALAR